MDKCEWKDGQFKQCEMWSKNRRHGCHHYMWEDVSYCPFCGADIRKPELEVIIKKSGETWVAGHNGVDYLCIDDECCCTSGDNCPMYKQDIASRKNCSVPEKNQLCIKSKIYAPFSEIEITDEIAKLRPMAVLFDAKEDENDFPDTLIAVVESKYPFRGINSSGRKNCRLATVDDLE